ncbi:hypothetical protein E3N88_24269 [Mikania micrantha]|uniref:Protease Do-like PDZ domain-containing protein n=1 Tax=Mikania micrantha TaxID=192012 RepID=A0A5N6NIB9_9ASTR|nr:hypothetical protein E3N88_24269 [Mikania micrantha]
MEKSARKRGRKSKNATDEEPNPDPATTATTSTGAAADTVVASFNAADTTTTDRRGSKRRRKTEKSKGDDAPIVTSPERRASRYGEHNGDYDVMAVVPEVPPRWEGVGKVVPSMDAVVKVFCVHTEPNFSLPWQRKRQYSSSSSGFIIGGRRVLTNAHSVEHHTQVKVKKRGSDTKYLATVLAIGTECDIAMLTVTDDEFWEGISPLEFGDLPALQDAVTVVGYPIGGDTISVTSGVVSRIEILSYVHGSTELLGLQIDAAINSGNSGGPAFNDKGECVGIAFQSLKHEDAENIGYVIPTPVITHFIWDYEKNGEYTGFPILGVEWQKMENPDLRKSMGMGNEHKGVRIKRIEPTAPESNVLSPSDIILSFDGISVANDGTVPFRHGERIGFSYLVSQKYTGDKALVKILRNSKIKEFHIKLATHKRLIPAHIGGKPPSYYIIAGFVFAAVSVPYLRSEYGKDYDFDAPVKLLDKHLHVMAESVDEQVVVVSQVLVADINIGYEEIVNTQVIAFNNKPVKNLKSLADMVENCNEEFLKFDLEYEQDKKRIPVEDVTRVGDFTGERERPAAESARSGVGDVTKGVEECELESGDLGLQPKDVAQFFLDHVYKLHRCPTPIVYDYYRVFMSIFWKEFMVIQGIKGFRPPIYIPYVRRDAPVSVVDELMRDRESILSLLLESLMKAQNWMKQQVGKHKSEHELEASLDDAQIHPVFHVTLLKTAAGLPGKVLPISKDSSFPLHQMGVDCDGAYGRRDCRRRLPWEYGCGSKEPSAQLLQNLQEDDDDQIWGILRIKVEGGEARKKLEKRAGQVGNVYYQ